MRIELNGERQELADGATVADAVRAAGGDPEARGVAVAVDGEVVPHSEWGKHLVSGGARVEVVAAIQGGAGDGWLLGGRQFDSG